MNVAKYLFLPYGISGQLPYTGIFFLEKSYAPTHLRRKRLVHQR